MSSRALRKLQKEAEAGLEAEVNPSDDDISFARPSVTGARSKIANPFDLVSK
jgi:hypothetical protein